MTMTGVINQQGLASLFADGSPIAAPSPEDLGVELRGAIAGWFPALPPTPKPLGCRVPDRTPEREAPPRQLSMGVDGIRESYSGRHKSRDMGEDVGEDEEAAQ